MRVDREAKSWLAKKGQCHACDRTVRPAVKGSEALSFFFSPSESKTYKISVYRRLLPQMAWNEFHSFIYFLQSKLQTSKWPHPPSRHFNCWCKTNYYHAVFSLHNTAKSKQRFYLTIKTLGSQTVKHNLASLFVFSLSSNNTLSTTQTNFAK